MKKILSLLLSIALVVSIAPFYGPASVSANDSRFFTFADFSTERLAPTLVNSNRVNLAGTFAEVSAPSISYSIQRIVNGVPIGQPSSGTAAPLVTGNSFMFTGVELFEGLNEITVSGVSNANQQGGLVSAKSYVTFNNVPLITDIEIAGGVRLVEGVEQVTTMQNPPLMVRANNATEVSINGTVAFDGAGGTYIHSGLSLSRGLNTIEIVARNGNKSYAVTRKIIYFPNNAATPHNIIATRNTNSVQLDTKEIVQPFTDHTISGKIIVRLPNDSDTDAPPVVSLELLNGSTTVTIPANNVTVNPVPTRQTTTFREYEFTSTTEVSASSNGNYTLRVLTDYLGQLQTPVIPFTVRNNNSPYIEDIRQLYNVELVGSGPAITYSSDTRFSNNATIHQAPIWLAIDANNFNLGSGNTTAITATVNGVPIPTAEMNIESYEHHITTGSDTLVRRVYKINALPEGEIQLSFTITAGGNTYTTSRTFNYAPVSSIQILNLYDGQPFRSDTNPVSQIVGKLINFGLASDLNTLQFTLNGQSRPMTLTTTTGTPAAGQVNLTTGDFVYALPTGVSLVHGSNEIVISGRTSGVNVSSRVMVYWFSATQPSVSGLMPVPYTINPYNDHQNTRYQTDEVSQKFTQLSDNSYTTTETHFDLLFDAANLQNLNIRIDGQDVLSTTVDTDPQSLNNIIINNPNMMYAESNNAGGNRQYRLRLFGIELPTSGPMSVTITAMVGSESYTQTITIIRELSPYVLLSPMLPQERVVNQNFLNVSIRAEGADRIVIGKDDMVKKATEDLFRYQVKNLKAGNNTIRFTIHRGTEKLNGQFTVNYAADNTIGAQFKTSITSNGRISAFKGELAMSFPKNTFLRQANTNPGQPVTSPDLFDSQEILFGIADRNDGRTLKIYNDVGDDSNGVAQDGIFKTVSYDEIGAAVIAPLNHFGFASNLFWIDPGYKTGAYMDGYQFQEGSHPYAAGNEFISRPLDRWLETSNKGTITLKYDSAIRDVMSNTLSIWRYYNGRWTNIGGVVNTRNSTITAPVDGFGYYAVKMLRFSFPDVIGHEYARNSMELMFSRGMMNNKDFNEFGVYDNITRGEFAQLLVKMFQIPLDYDNNMTFSDVPPILGLSNLWDYRYIETAARKGIVRGSGAQIFQPNEFLTREDAAVMIARAGDLVRNTGDNFDKDRTALQKRFTDANLIQNYSLASILAITNAKFIEGLPNTQLEGRPTFRFDPRSPLKRADAAIIAERVMRKNKFV